MRYKFATDTERVIGHLLFAAVSVLDWGAICDGFADDTVALQKAVFAGGGEVLTFPSGVCVTGPLELPEKTHLLGPGTLRLRD